MDKYKLREGEILIEEYIEDGEHVTIFKDKNGETLYGRSIEIDGDLMIAMEKSAVERNMDIDDFFQMVVEDAIRVAMEQEERKKAIEEFSK